MALKMSITRTLNLLKFANNLTLINRRLLARCSTPTLTSHPVESWRNFRKSNFMNSVADFVASPPSSDSEPPTKRAKTMPEQTDAKTQTKNGAAGDFAAVSPSSDGVKLQFYKLTENAYDPVRGSDEAAGLDLCSAEDVLIPKCGKAIAPTDLQIALPEGCYGRVAPRSGLSWKNHIDVGAGVIDRDYRGNVGVVLFNHASTDFQVKKGDRVAQLILERIYIPEVVESKTVLPETKRGAGGFGSTGMSAEVSDKTETKEHQNGKMSSEELSDKTETKVSKEHKNGKTDETDSKS